MWARKSFSPAVMDETKELNDYISQSDLKYRNDCRDLLTYTIDGAESKDLDDAISLEKTDSGYILYVHIADVSHYVREDTPLDREARKRGTSIYLADQVIPMLPKEISNGLCSLHPGEDKLTLTCEMHISKSWIVTKSEVYNSVIISDYRLTYQEIDEFVSWDIKSWDDLLFWEKVSEYLSENIQDLKSLTDVLSKNTENRGSLDFDFPETKIILDDQGNPTEYKKSIRYDSYKIIEECMVLANESVSKQFQKHPFLYRVHEDPDGEDVEKFTKMLETVIPGTEIPEDFPGILALLQSSEQLQYLQKLLLRSLSKARYSEKNLGHFGLALKFYSHFTSPIRRYPDLQIHRIIKEICKWKFSSERRGYYNEILPKVARRSSDTADRSEKMEYKVRDMLACKYMSDKIGKQFTANISGMIEKGFFVELPDTIEWFVDYGMTGLTYNPERMLLEDAIWKELHFGSEVQVILIDIDTSRMRLEFELV